MSIDGHVQYYNSTRLSLSKLIAVLACANSVTQPGQLDAL